MKLAGCGTDGVMKLGADRGPVGIDSPDTACADHPPRIRVRVIEHGEHRLGRGRHSDRIARHGVAPVGPSVRPRGQRSWSSPRSCRLRTSHRAPELRPACGRTPITSRRRGLGPSGAGVVAAVMGPPSAVEVLPKRCPSPERRNLCTTGYREHRRARWCDGCDAVHADRARAALASGGRWGRRA